MAELRELLETCQFSQWLSIKGYFASNRQWGEFTKNYIYTLRKKEEQVMKKHILMIEKFCAVWIKNIHGIKYWLWMFWLEWLNVKLNLTKLKYYCERVSFNVCFIRQILITVNKLFSRPRIFREVRKSFAVANIYRSEPAFVEWLL